MVTVHRKETEEFGAFVMLGLTRICMGCCIAAFLIMMISWFHTRPYAFAINFVMLLVSIAYFVYIYYRLQRVESLSFLKLRNPEAEVGTVEKVGSQEYERAGTEAEQWYEWKDQEKVRWVQLYTHPLTKLNKNIILSLREVPAMREYMEKIDPAVSQLFTNDVLEMTAEHMARNNDVNK